MRGERKGVLTSRIDATSPMEQPIDLSRVKDDTQKNERKRGMNDRGKDENEYIHVDNHGETSLLPLIMIDYIDFIIIVPAKNPKGAMSEFLSNVEIILPDGQTRGSDDERREMGLNEYE